jgi:hypothetical protein
MFHITTIEHRWGHNSGRVGTPDVTICWLGRDVENLRLLPKGSIGSFTKGCHIVLWFGPKLNEWPKQSKFVVGMLFVDTLLFAWQLIWIIYSFWEVRIVNGQSPTFQQFNLTRNSRCLHKRIHCEGENAMNCIVARKRLFLDGLTPEIEAETPD